METKDLFIAEGECDLRFSESGPCFHLCTDEDQPIIFHNESEFEVAMNITALASSLFPDIIIMTFAIMSNHLHYAICGDYGQILAWFKKLIYLLKVHPVLENSKNSISSLQPKIIPIKSIENMRNVIAYINRNGFVVNYNYTPFSYPWGANIYFFNREARMRYDALKTKATSRCKRKLFHSNLADTLSEFYLLDGYLSPLCFCDIAMAEGFFRNAQHYFSKISKSIESSATIAKEIGESLYYLDDELYSIISMKCSKKYGIKSPGLIPPNDKISMAKVMRFDYNASAKQISRIMKMDISTVRRLFPEIQI